MPMVNGKKYPYTEQGKKEAAKARKKKYGGGRAMYNKGGKAQPNYKSGDMPKCMPN
tara:strand:+ start:109 stop:276 length:168 start_codon:yes stop_codon:yes gene_type:complete